MMLTRSPLVFLLPCMASAFMTPSPSLSRTASIVMRGYLDDLSQELYAPDGSSSMDEVDRSLTQMDKGKVDRYGAGSWEGYVDFDEFDGGDGQMGVAGDGKKGLDKEWAGAAEIVKSKSMSAKNAWGTSTGYADELVDQGMEATRAQQMENWRNQQEVLEARKQQRFMTESFDQVEEAGETDWRNLSGYVAGRNQDFDLDETLGAVVPGETISHHIELQSRIGQAKVFEFDVKNSFMGYSDFRARFTAETGQDWTIEPNEGSLNGKKGTDFLVKYNPGSPSATSGYLVIETEDDKWTFQVTGTASM